MSNTEATEQPQGGQVFLTPEAGPLDQGVPASVPGAGQVQATPEAGPLSDDQALSPPTWRENMRGPILGLDDVPGAGVEQSRRLPPPVEGGLGGSRGVEETPPSVGERLTEASGSQGDERELRKWPPYTGKPVTDVSEAMRYVAPIASQAEKLAIQAIDLSARGLAGLARYLESRREERKSTLSRDSDRLK